jgi:WhiB family redox-sensing transcriptional regulator
MSELRHHSRDHDAEWMLQQERVVNDAIMRKQRRGKAKSPSLDVAAPRRIATTTPSQRAAAAEKLRDAADRLGAPHSDLDMVLDMLGLGDAVTATSYTDKGERRPMVAACPVCGRPTIQLRTDGTFISHPRESKQPLNDGTRCPGTGTPAGDRARLRDKQPKKVNPAPRTVRAAAQAGHGLPGEHTACQDLDRELFYPLTYGPASADQVEQAKRVCRGCPLRAACLRYALDHGELTYGIWGATTPNERKALTRKAAA